MTMTNDTSSSLPVSPVRLIAMAGVLAAGVTLAGHLLRGRRSDPSKPPQAEMGLRCAGTGSAVRQRQAPSVGAMLAEVAGLRHRMSFGPIRSLAGRMPGHGMPVIVVPGFMIHDVFSLRLRRTLRLLGYDARGWEMGLNRGLRPDTLAAMTALLERTYARTGRRVVMVGWSLGGIFVREVAKTRPDLVERVVTMATPFSGDPRSNNLWRAYERIAGHPVDRLPIPVVIAEKPPVPTYAIWTRRDGMILPSCTSGLEGERDVAIEVDCRHVDMIASPASVSALIDVLEIPPRP